MVERPSIDPCACPTCLWLCAITGHGSHGGAFTCINCGTYLVRWLDFFENMWRTRVIGREEFRDLTGDIQNRLKQVRDLVIQRAHQLTLANACQGNARA